MCGLCSGRAQACPRRPVLSVATFYVAASFGFFVLWVLCFSSAYRWGVFSLCFCFVPPPSPVRHCKLLGVHHLLLWRSKHPYFVILRHLLCSSLSCPCARDLKALCPIFPADCDWLLATGRFRKGKGLSNLSSWTTASPTRIRRGGNYGNTPFQPEAGARAEHLGVSCASAQTRLDIL